MRSLWIGAGLALALATAGTASAASEKFAATLKGSSETPANTTNGTGKLDATLDTASKAFDYTVTYSGLTGPATGAHFHGPAGPGASGPPVVPVPASKLASPIKGSATLTDAQIKDLEAGQWYFNIHTAANPGGEIRGQVIKP